MSAQNARVTNLRPANRFETKARPQLQLVGLPAAPARRAYSRLTAALVVLIVLAAVFGTMVIHAQMAIDAHQISKVQQELVDLRMDNEILRTELKVEQSAPRLAEKAAQHGLVPAGQVGTITLKTKTVKPGKPAGQ